MIDKFLSNIDFFSKIKKTSTPDIYSNFLK